MPTSNTPKTTTKKTPAKKAPTAAEKQRRAAQAATPQGTPTYGQGWSGADSLKDIRCPSGAVVQVRRIGVQGLISEGILESMDSLTAIVTTEVIPKAEGKNPAADIKALAEDPKKIEDMIAMLDRITLAVVEQPKLEKRPDPDENGKITYEPGKFYIDLVDVQDKSFIMNFVVGGSRDVEAFREGTEEAVGGE